jgi:hypothetical protein
MAKLARLALPALAFLLTGTSTAFAQTAKTPLFFAPGNLVVVVEGCGVQGGTCTSIPGGGTGTGDGTGNSTKGGYGDNQAAPISLFQFTPNAAASATFVNALVLPQTGSGANLPTSGEYGSSSEGGLQLSGTGQYLTLGTYGINAGVFNAAVATTFGDTTAIPALAQTGSLTGQTAYTPVARVVTLVDPFGNVNSSSALFNIFNTNNPRSIYTADGTTAYISGQGTGSGTDATGGVFYTPLGAVNTSPTAITGQDATGNTLSQDTRFLTVFNNTLYVSVDTKGGSNSTRSFIGTLGTPPATTLYSNNAGPTQVVASNNAAAPVVVTSNGKLALTASEVNTVNTGQVGKTINLSPSQFFFANAYTMYIADTGNSKQTSGSSLYGDGGLQKWINTKTDGTGTWVLQYTLSLGLNLIANTNAVAANVSGTTGLYGLTGVVSGSNVYLYATNSTLADLDPTFLYGISDPIAATTNPGTAFALLATAPADSNFKGVSFAPTLPAGSVTITTVPSGLTVTTAGTGCAPGTYVTPVTLIWTPGNSCTLTTTSPQTSGSTPYVFTQWGDGTTATTDIVSAPATSATYTANFTSNAAPVITVAPVSTVFATTTSTLTAMVAYAGAVAPAGPVTFTVNGSATGVGSATCTGSASPLTCTATYNPSTLAVGSYPIVATIAATPSYVSAQGTGTFTVTAATDFTFTNSGASSQTVVKGSATSFTFNLAKLVASYPATVNFSVSGLPAGATATFSPASVAANGASQAVTLSVQTSATAALHMPGSPWKDTSIAFAALCLLPLCFRRKLRSGVARNVTLLLLLCGSAVAVTAITGCSSGGALPTPPVTYPLTVTATSGTVQHSVAVSLVLQTSFPQ